ncbi:peptidoglycan-N-acetylglucosamine deacetylase [Pseudomonas sp. IT-P258]|uniref:polysaccharide deacetylase family protein n=1 Tax=Pseudomonas sp. IT-P258 TaxID=3026447 RepID=UPI0039E03B67
MERKKVWLTFDDGPRQIQTDTVLETLAQFDIKATFFIVGNLVARHGERIKRILCEGHRIGNHTYDHLRLVGQDKDTIIDQIKMTEQALAPYQQPDLIMRPPYGAHDAMVDRTVAELGYRQVLWSVDTLDWNSNYQPGGWVSHGVEQIRKRKNSIVLMHDIHATTANNLGRFIEQVNQLGDVDFESPATLAIPPVSQLNMYVVVKGDTLSKIAREFYGDAAKYPLIFNANRSVLEYPDKIYPGLSLIIPPQE